MCAAEPFAPLPMELGRLFMPEALTPLFFTPVYAGLTAEQRLYYNQLQACCFNEQIVFFESLIGDGVMQALLKENWPPTFARQLRQFWQEEQAHSAMFRRLNRSSRPQWYERADYHFVRFAPPLWAFIRWAARHPRLFPMLLWLMLLQEERSLHYSSEFLRHRQQLEPHFVEAYRLHMIDEAGHVRSDLALLDQWWPSLSMRSRQRNARWLAWVIREFVSGPKRGQWRVIEALLQAFPVLQAQRRWIREQVVALEQNETFQLSLYSRRIVPRSFERFDQWPELQVLEGAIRGYRWQGKAQAC